MNNDIFKILLIDDIKIDVRIFEKLLDKIEDEQHELLVTNTLEEGKKILDDNSINIVFLDLHLPDSSIEQTLDFVSEYEEKFPFIILSSIHDKQQRIRAIQKGAQDYLVKNEFDKQLLSRVINYSLERHHLHKELHTYANELREKEQRLIESQAIAQLGNWDLLLDNDTIEWSPEARLILELNLEKNFTSLEWLVNLVKDEEKDNVWNIFRQAIEGSRDFNTDLKVMLPNGNRKYINLRIRSTEVDDEKNKKIRGTIQDITFRKEMENALMFSEEKYHRLFEESTDAIFITTDAGKFVDFNRAMLDLFGYSAEELVNIHVSQLYFNPFEREVIKKIIKEKGLIREYEVALRRIDGTKIECVISSTPWRSNDGKLRGYQGIIRDITERKRNEELVRNKEIAERSSRLKQRFLANMSHEIRTPITSIAGLTHLILKTTLTPQQQEYVNGIRTSSEHLLALVNDILDYSKIEEGKVKFHLLEFNLRAHLTQLFKTMEYAALNKNIQYLHEFDDNLPENIVGDPIRLNQIIFNLLSNAIKFTDRGLVKLSARLVEDAKNAVVISIVVQDTGIGIPENKLHTIFRSFTQLGKDVTKTAEGTGLGLAITRQLIELQGGTINVKSKPDEGSTFEVMMMFKKQVDTTEKPEQSRESENNQLDSIDIGFKKILIVEDKKLNQLVTTEMLKSRWKNIETAIADNGKEAVEILRHKKFDLVLMDVQMPEMDGYEATKAIRADLKIPYSVMPILAMTAYTTDNETQQCLEAGMNDFVAKPFDPEQLYRKIIGLVLHTASDHSYLAESTSYNYNDGEHLNLAYLNQITNGNATLKSKIIQMLIEETPEELFQLKKFTREKSWKRTRAIAHKMKSGISYLGLANTLNDIKLIEEYAGNEIRLDKIPALVEKVDVACTKAINELVRMKSVL